MLIKRLISRILKKADKPEVRVEREIWYEFTQRYREWDYQWQQYLAGLNDKKPMDREKFIDRLIKLYKLSDREQKKS